MPQVTHPIHEARAAATKVVEVLQQAGFEAYFAGGCVRDRLLGLSPKDYDVATAARPEDVCNLFRNTQMVGEAFGVALVRLMGHAVEVATFRAEWDYEDGRHPTHVAFCDAAEDAKRRDFTVNALFENPLADDADKRIIDHVGGCDDLNRQVIRAVGQADQRLGEDYLRMLRAVRFATRLGFALEPTTAEAIRKHGRSLSHISRERVGQELRAMLRPSQVDVPIDSSQDSNRDSSPDSSPDDSRSNPPDDHPASSDDWLDQHTAAMFAGLRTLADGADTGSKSGNKNETESETEGDAADTSASASKSESKSNQATAAVRLLIALELDGHVLTEPHLDSPIETVERLSPRASYPTRLAAWLLDRWRGRMQARSDFATSPAAAPSMEVMLEHFLTSEGREMLRRWRQAIQLSNAERDACWTCIDLAVRMLHWDDLEPAGRMRLLAMDAGPEAMLLLAAMSHLPEAAAAGRQIVREAPALLEAGVAPTPLVTGADLIQLGMKPGPMFRDLLDAVYDAQLVGRVQTREDAVAFLADPA